MPLRGKKGSLFDGGIRGAAFVWGEMIPATRRGTEYAGLMHVTDWLPSLLTLATGSPWTPTCVALLLAVCVGVCVGVQVMRECVRRCRCVGDVCVYIGRCRCGRVCM